MVMTLYTVNFSMQLQNWWHMKRSKEAIAQQPLAQASKTPNTLAEPNSQTKATQKLTVAVFH